MFSFLHGLEQTMDEAIEVSYEVDSTVLLEASIEEPCFGVEFREIADISEVMVSLHRRGCCC